MQIVYEDNHLLALDKPPGLLTQPSGRDEESLESRAKEEIKRREGKKGSVFLEAVHRIDRAASGIVVFAKTSKALSRLMGAVREGHFSKTYLAWVEGTLGKEGLLEDRLLHRHHRAEVSQEGKSARLSYRELERADGQTLYEINLETGRYHQIRIQFGVRESPVVGDVKYGARPHSHPGILLHHLRCTLPHPIGKTPLTLESYPRYNGWHA